MTQAAPTLGADDRTYPARPILAASVAVFRDGKVLIATRTKPPGAGVWSLPGGLVEPGETLEEGALRELMEEVGVEARIVGFNRHVQRIDRDDEGRVRHHFVVASFVGVWTGGPPISRQVRVSFRLCCWLSAQSTWTRPSAADRAPYLAALVANSWKIMPNDRAAAGVRGRGGPLRLTRCDP